MLIRAFSNTEATFDAPAKVNLFLQVLSKRPDGYHNINSLFQAVTLFDRLQFSVIDKSEINIELSCEVNLPVGSDNLIAKAYQAVKKQCGLKRGLSVKLHKNIPVSAGLGGGSSDAAATIAACNLLFDLQLSYTQMAAIGLAIGSDVPFFFSRGQALISGRGEIVVDTNFPIDYQLVLVTPDIAVSTADSYEALKMDLTKRKTLFKLKEYKKLVEFARALRLAANDFESIQGSAFPELVKIRQELLELGALLVRMTGSGPTMFGVFAKESTDISTGFEKKEWRLYTVEPILLPGQGTTLKGRNRGNHRNLGEGAG
jgi:4-diphosphocytidyl-2-C-methyl-D-erythritol kinase